MTRSISLPILATALASLTLAGPVIASPGSVRDFQLPPPSPTPTPTNMPQGPIDVEDGIFITPRGVPTVRPTPRPTERAAQPPAATPTATPSVSPPSPTSPAAARATPRPTGSAPSSPAATDTGDAGLTPDAGAIADANAPTSPASLPAAPATDAVTAAPPAMALAGLWPWLAATAGLILVLAASLLFWRRKRRAARSWPEEAETPVIAAEGDEIVPPVIAPIAPPPSPSAAPLSPLAATKAPRVPVQLRVEAVSLSRSMMNATLSYQIMLRNMGTKNLTDIRVSADMVTAHGQAPVADQMASKESQLPQVAIVAEIAPRETQPLTGDIRLPVGQIRTIRQGKAHLYVPLLRVRIDGEGKDPIIRTFVVGTLPPAGQSKLQPFRLDELAQTYRNIGLRALD